PSDGTYIKVLAIDLPHARRLAFGVVLGQAVVSVTAALCAGGFAGARAGLSALLGGGIATAGSLAMAGLVFGRGAGASAQRALDVGEAVKLAVVIVLFVVALKVTRVAPMPMLATFAATYLVYWIALIATLPASASGQRGA